MAHMEAVTLPVQYSVEPPPTSASLYCKTGASPRRRPVCGTQTWLMSNTESFTVTDSANSRPLLYGPQRISLMAPQQRRESHLKMMSSTSVSVAPMLFSSRFRDWMASVSSTKSSPLEPRDRLRWSWNKHTNTKMETQPWPRDDTGLILNPNIHLVDLTI